MDLIHTWFHSTATISYDTNAHKLKFCIQRHKVSGMECEHMNICANCKVVGYYWERKYRTHYLAITRLIIFFCLLPPSSKNLRWWYMRELVFVYAKNVNLYELLNLSFVSERDTSVNHFSFHVRIHLGVFLFVRLFVCSIFIFTESFLFGISIKTHTYLFHSLLRSLSLSLFFTLSLNSNHFSAKATTNIFSFASTFNSLLQSAHLYLYPHL